MGRFYIRFRYRIYKTASFAHAFAYANPLGVMPVDLALGVGGVGEL